MVFSGKKITRRQAVIILAASGLAPLTPSRELKDGGLLGEWNITLNKG